MTRRKRKAQELVRASTYTPPPPGICESCGQALEDESAHCRVTGVCMDECTCDDEQHGGRQ